MASSRVIVVGCGVAGPVIACLLKQKGYGPVIFERAAEPGDIGASFVVGPNGLKVLDLIGSITEKLLENGPAAQVLEDFTATGTQLGFSRVPADFASLYGKPAVGVKRTLLASWMREVAQGQGIEIRDGWSLERIEETDGDVTAYFNGDRSETGSFLVACDGLKATSRKVLLARQGVSDGLPTFTGLTQTSGISPTPAKFQGSPGIRNWYGANMHVVCYPITHDRTSWGVTLPGDSGSEASWGLVVGEQRDSMLKTLGEQLKDQNWDSSVQEMVAGAERLIKYGIFDRPGLEVGQWHSGRCVLVGDAVHPMSVHIGQGANQACEDCYYLAQELPSFNPDKPLSTTQLSRAFTAYAEKQLPHVSVLFEAARKQAGVRVVPAEACAKRDQLVSGALQDGDKLQAKFSHTFKRPF